MPSRPGVIWIGVVAVVAGTLLCRAVLINKKPPIRDATATVSQMPSFVESPPASIVTERPAPQDNLQTSTQDSLTPATPPLLVDPDRERMARLDNAVNQQSVEYSASFRPGVYMEDPIPQFAVTSLQETLLKDTDIVAAYTQHQRSPADAWSLEMESHLRTFFESQPEIATVRVGISCRAAQCILQIVKYAEMTAPGTPGLAQQFLDRLKQQAWYRENLVRGKTMGSLPGSFHYSSLTLRRQDIGK